MRDYLSRFALLVVASVAFAEDQADGRAAPLYSLTETVGSMAAQAGMAPAPLAAAAPAPARTSPVSSRGGHLTVGCGRETFFLESRSLGGQSDCQEALYYQVGRDFRVSLEHTNAAFDPRITKSFGRTQESTAFSLRAKVLPFATLSAVLRSQKSASGAGYDAQGLYIDLQNGSPFSEAPRLTLGGETDNTSNLLIATVRQKRGDVALYGGASSYRQRFTNNMERTDGRYAGAIQVFLPKDQTAIVGYGRAEDGASSRLAGISGSFGSSKTNEWFAVCRRRGARDSGGVERATDHCMVHVALDGDGHYVFLLGEFFPGLLKSSKIVDNSNVTDWRPSASKTLTEKPYWSFSVAHTAVAMTDTLGLVMDSVAVTHRFSQSGGVGSPYASLALNETEEPYFDPIKRKMRQAKERIISLAVGAGFNVFDDSKRPLEGELTVFRGTSKGIRIVFSRGF